ncbi:MAG: exonuclease SbcCD subunit D [Synechococcus sp.]
MAKTTARFLHVADIHLGYDRYDSPERTLDFFYTFSDVLLRYGLQESVDFVLVAGDLFEHRTILPSVLNQAELALRPLRDAGISVLAIEGNHDNRPYGTNTSWLKYLAQRDLLILLEPLPGERGEFVLEPWDVERKFGSYIDLDCGVRVIGSRWYGAAAPTAITHLARAVTNLSPGPASTVLMFHHGMEGQVARYSGALKYGEILPLREAGIDYLALGHIHKNYELEDWVFNPGSLLANTAAEFDMQRGAYLVELDISKESKQRKAHVGVSASLQTDYLQRSCIRLRCEVKSSDSADDIVENALHTVDLAGIEPQQQAIVELKLVGQLGVERYELDLKTLKRDIQDKTNALVVLVKLEAESIQYDVAPNASEGDARLQVESQVFADLLARNNRYKKRNGELATLLVGLKEMLAEREPEHHLYDYLEKGLAGELPNE